MAKKNRKRGDCTIDRQDVNIVQILFVCYFVCLLFCLFVCLLVCYISVCWDVYLFVCYLVGRFVSLFVCSLWCLSVHSVGLSWVGFSRVG